MDERGSIYISLGEDYSVHPRYIHGHEGVFVLEK
jgi:hypothetical protein